MILALLFKGILIGLSIAMPIGPLDMLCIHNTLSMGRRHGFITGLGVSTADGICGAIAGFGVAAITPWFYAYRIIPQVLGGLFLCYLGMKTFFKDPQTQKVKGATSLMRPFFTTFFLTVSNPLTLLSFMGIFAALGMDGENMYTVLTVAAGVFLGSTLWWLILTGGSSLFRDWITQKKMRWLNRVSGSVLLMFGLVALLSFFFIF